jgi:hypothetical protein
LAVKRGRENFCKSQLHFFKNLPVHFAWHLNGGFTWVYETDLAFYTLGHIFSIVSYFIHEQSPFAYRVIFVLVQTCHSVDNRVIVNLSKVDFRVLRCKPWVLVVDSNYPVINDIRLLELIHDRGWLIRWSKTNNSICIQISRELMANNEI